MKAQVIQLNNNNSLSHILNACRTVLNAFVTAKKQRIEVEIRNAKESKTHQQLKAIFGAWFTWLQNTNKDNNSKDYYHQKYKLMFLKRIYESNPANDLQQNWADAVDLNIRVGNMERAVERTKSISLSWATKDQMTEYMRDIEVYHISTGNPLPIIADESARKAYARELNRLGIG